MMAKENFKYIYGPVSSWRLGTSLGIDLLSQEAKVCNFDCIYCQLGRTRAYRNERKLYIPTHAVIKELEKVPGIKVDYITFSGRGEPTLAENLGQVIKEVKKIRKEPIAILTNSALMVREDLRKELALADFVAAKLDVYSRESFEEINRPAPEIEFGDILKGIKSFRKEYHGRLALQIMFVGENKSKAKDLAYLANYIKPDEIQINTPLRPCNVKPLSREDIFKIKEYFEYFLFECKSDFSGREIDVISVYDTKKHKEVTPISNKETLIRRGKRL